MYPLLWKLTKKKKTLMLFYSINMHGISPFGVTHFVH